MKQRWLRVGAKATCRGAKRWNCWAGIEGLSLPWLILKLTHSWKHLFRILFQQSFDGMHPHVPIWKTHSSNLAEALLGVVAGNAMKTVARWLRQPNRQRQRSQNQRPLDTFGLIIEISCISRGILESCCLFESSAATICVFFFFYVAFSFRRIGCIEMF